jgi:site-specific recombinase XerD
MPNINKSLTRLRGKKVKNGFISLYLDVYHQGQRHYEFLKIHIHDNPSTQEERLHNREMISLAESIRAKRENEIKFSEHGFIPIFKERTNFLDYFEEYVRDYPNKDKRLVSACLKQFRVFVDTDQILAKDITEDMLLRFKKYLEGKYNGETPYNYFKKLKKVLKQAKHDHLMTTNPAESISNTRNEGLKKEILTFDEIRKLADTPCGNDEVRRAFLFCLNTGLRFSDLVSLTWQNIDNGKIVVRAQGKTKKPVYIDMNQNAKMMIGTRGKPSEKVFHLLSLEGTNKVLQSWVTRAGIPKHITWHCARHSFGVNLLIMKNDVKTVSGLLGHSSIRMTEIYTRIVDDLKKQAVDSLPDIFGKS